MPIYEFTCRRCNTTVEKYRPVGQYDAPHCSCGVIRELKLSRPAVQVWNTERRFPNVSPHGDGTMSFASKKAYYAHLEANKMHEVDYGGRRAAATARTILTDRTVTSTSRTEE